MDNLRALSKSLGQPFLAITFALLAALHSHVQRTKIMLELQVDSTFGGGQIDFFDVERTRDLVDFGDILMLAQRRRERD